MIIPGFVIGDWVIEPPEVVYDYVEIWEQVTAQFLLRLSDAV